MLAKLPVARLPKEAEEPPSQRPTLPSPLPFRAVSPPRRKAGAPRSPGAYRIVNDEAREEPPASTQRSPSCRGKALG